MPLDMQQLFMEWSSELVKFSFSSRCVMIQALYMSCVNTSVPRWKNLILLEDMNLHTSRIQDSVCKHRLVLG